MEEVTLKKIYRSDKKKDGTPLINKNGQPFEKIGIQTIEHGDRWLSGFGGPANKSWVEGDRVKIEVYQNGEYWNFKMPNTSGGVSREEFDQLAMQVRDLKAKLERLENKGDDFLGNLDEEGIAF